jgi:hypothetical protein
LVIGVLSVEPGTRPGFKTREREQEPPLSRFISAQFMMAN